ncbi:probable E3 ubiquitin-protein ligase RNF144A-A [Olea europaea var. sylvestris]|uniref:probable E3 ubiquitin-protein ligase RNF144A-A n=1 Tax=Olea europaea var. sylvestris TaxID=158386 RepID=UPI000C1D5FD8|nr:probable E3 ubiquitin-protein ligase RNF144A-A [Olea europaea var. sylvestris]
MAKESKELVSDVFNESFDLSCDDFYFSLLFNLESEVEEMILPVSDSLYAEELQLQESIMASIISSQNPRTDPISETVVGESSRRFCKICIGSKESDEMFTIPGCNHQFCAECISEHVAIKVQETAVVKCPELDCRATLNIDSSREIISKYAITTWEDVLCESLIPPSQKFYCPYKDCSAMLVKDTDEVIRESICPFCWRLFCAQCNVSWHSGVECEEFQRMNEHERGREDLMVYELAKQKNWQRCPKCKFFVERNEGCLHISCRCKFEFCYGCGASWSSNHSGCRP